MKWHIVPVIASVRLWNLFNDEEKLVIFLANHKQTQRKLLLFLNGMNDRLLKSAKMRLLKSIFNSFQKFALTAQQPKWENSCSKMWSIEQLYIELGNLS